MDDEESVADEREPKPKSASEPDAVKGFGFRRANTLFETGSACGEVPILSLRNHS